MNPITEQLNLLPQDYRDFVMSPFSAEVAEAVQLEYNLGQLTKDHIQDGILNLLLFFITQKQLQTYLEKDVGLTATQSEECVDTILALLPDSFPFELIADDKLSDEIAALERTVSHLEPIRTMAHDMSSYPEEKIHASSQDAILGRNTNETPRWETDNN